MAQWVVPCCGPPYHVLVAPPIALRHSTPHLLCEQLLAAVVGGAVIVVDLNWSPSPCHHLYARAFLPMSSCL